MTSLLITRLAGRRAVVQLIPTGVASLVWAGELRTDNDQPAPGHITCGVPDTAGLHGVLQRLSVQARIAAVPNDEERVL